VCVCVCVCERERRSRPAAPRLQTRVTDTFVALYGEARDRPESSTVNRHTQRIVRLFIRGSWRTHSPLQRKPASG